MKNLFTQPDFNEILGRVQLLDQHSVRQWGKMNVYQMVCHLSDAFRDLLGIRNLTPVTPPEMWPKILEMVLIEEDWDHDLPTFPPYLQDVGGGGTVPTHFEEDKASLLTLLESFQTLPVDFSFFPHAGLGYLTREQAGQFMWKHMDHHLRQFGV